MAANDNRQIGDRVRFWIAQTGMTPQYGTIAAFHTDQDIQSAKIIPDGHTHKPVYLYLNAVWGYEGVDENMLTTGKEGVA